MYEQGSFEPVARIVQLSEVLENQRIDNAVTHVWQYVPSGIVTQDVLDNVEKAKQPLVKIYHYHNNHLGTPQELSDEKGDVVWLSYDRAWGGSFETIYKQQFIDDWSISEAELQPIKFQGQSLDVETGLHYNRFRYYDSDVGMFISRDPIGLLGGNNVFQYAPNPIGWIDPWGLANRPNNGKYKSYVTHTVPINDQYSSDSIQFRQANKALRAQLDNNQSFAQKMYKKYPKLETWTDMGKSPPGLTWHHHEDVRKLVLVDRKDHKANHGLYHPTGQGGRDIWGGGKPGREGKLDGKTGKLKNPCNSI